MIEKTILDHLAEALSVACVMEVPSNPPTEFVLIEKTGSSESNLIYSSTFAIQSYSTSLYKAASLNESVKNAMKSLIEEDSVGSCRLNSDYNYSDTSKKKYRYQAVFNITHY